METAIYSTLNAVTLVLCSLLTTTVTDMVKSSSYFIVEFSIKDLSVIFSVNDFNESTALKCFNSEFLCRSIRNLPSQIRE